MSTVATRVPLTGRTSFRPSDAIARVSLAWWDPSEREGARDPILVQAPHGYVRTLVIVWPTNRQGYVHTEGLHHGEIDVRPWDLRPKEVDDLRTRSEDWPLDLHDLLITREWIWPCSESLLMADIGLDLDRRITQALSTFSLIQEVDVRTSCV